MLGFRNNMAAARIAMANKAIANKWFTMGFLSEKGE